MVLRRGGDGCSQLWGEEMGLEAIVSVGLEHSLVYWRSG